MISSTRIATNTPRSTEGLTQQELNEELAATRIQALYRGRRARKGQKHAAIRKQARRPPSDKNRRSHEESETGQPKSTVSDSFDGPVHHASSSSSSVPADGSEAEQKAKKTISFKDSECSGVSSGDAKSWSGYRSGRSDYTVMRNELESRPTTVPAHIQRIRITLYLLIEEPRSSGSAKSLSILLLGMICLSILCFIIETMPELKHVPSDVWLVIEICCTVAFTFEYLIRLSVCGVVGTTPWLFVTNTMNIFDLLAILPFYFWVAMRSLSAAKALGVLRTVRMVRIFRIFKLGRYSVGLQLMAEALKNSSQALSVLSFFLCIGILLFSSAIYYVEKMDCPDVDDLRGKRDVNYGSSSNTTRTEWDRYVEDCHVSKDGKHRTYGLCCDEHGSPLDFPSVIEAFWWATVTMTTVGFGEVYPRTELGRLVASGTMLSGILLIALPVAIIGRKFQEVYDKDAFLARSKYLDMIAHRDVQDDTEASSSQPSARPSPTGSVASSMQDVPTLHEMSRRLRLMKLPDSSMTQLALELADGFDEAVDMDTEIKSMEADEKEHEVELLDRFDSVIKRVTDLVEESAGGKANGVGWSRLTLNHGFTGTVATAMHTSKTQELSKPTKGAAAPDVAARPLSPSKKAKSAGALVMVKPHQSEAAQA